MNATDQLILFVKQPLPGSVKTRLAAAIGYEAAANAYRTMVEDLLVRLEEWSNMQLRFTPASARASIVPWLRPNWTCVAQSGDDLGQRLLEAFKASRTAGFTKTIIIGSDCPYIEPADIRQALERLDTCDLVLGPAQDGGYWLIGLQEPHAELFEGVSWSTDRVLLETIERADQLGLIWSKLRTLTDIDTPKDWKAYLQARDPKQ